MELNPVEVLFEVDAPRYVRASIVTEDGFVGEGIAVCSVLDDYEFSERKGKNIAAGRAVKAIVNQENSEDLRTDYEFFPTSWTLKRAERVIDVGLNVGPFKSSFYRIH